LSAASTGTTTRLPTRQRGCRPVSTSLVGGGAADAQARAQLHDLSPGSSLGCSVVASARAAVAPGRGVGDATPDSGRPRMRVEVRSNIEAAVLSSAKVEGRMMLVIACGLDQGRNSAD